MNRRGKVITPQKFYPCSGTGELRTYAEIPFGRFK